jgi:hypothetical protein
MSTFSGIGTGEYGSYRRKPGPNKDSDASACAKTFMGSIAARGTPLTISFFILHLNFLLTPAESGKRGSPVQTIQGKPATLPPRRGADPVGG